MVPKRSMIVFLFTMVGVTILTIQTIWFKTVDINCDRLVQTSTLQPLSFTSSWSTNVTTEPIYNATPSTCDCDQVEGHSTETTSTPNTTLPSQFESLINGERSARCMLVVLVLSSSQGRDRRDAIRETWGKDHQSMHPSVLIKFVIGTMNTSQAIIQNLTSEHESNQDLVLLPKLHDTYANLTRKVLYSLQWADENVDFAYLLKTDDDSYVVLNKMAWELSVRKHERSLYWGFFSGRNRPFRVGKWAEPDWFLCDRYLPYAYGGGYVLSQDLVHRIASNADALHLYKSEDVSVGVWLAPYRAERKHDVRFNTQSKSRGCNNKYLVSHKQGVKDMHTMYRLYQEKRVLCKKEFQVKLSYWYNWRASPSQCCNEKKGIP